MHLPGIFGFEEACNCFARGTYIRQETVGGNVGAIKRTCPNESKQTQFDSARAIDGQIVRYRQQQPHALHSSCFPALSIIRPQSNITNPNSSATVLSTAFTSA